LYRGTRVCHSRSPPPRSVLPRRLHRGRVAKRQARASWQNGIRALTLVLVTTHEPDPNTPSLFLAPPKNLPVVWLDADTDLIPANVFQIQLSPDGILIVAGFAKPPLLSGTREEQQVQAARITSITVRPAVRLLISARNVQQLATSLQQMSEAANPTIPPGALPPSSQESRG
jgi:hypothetical protein